MALAMVLHLGHTVKAITVAAGNTDLENAYNNTLRTLKVLNKTNVRIIIIHSLLPSFANSYSNEQRVIAYVPIMPIHDRAFLDHVTSLLLIT